MLNKCIAMINRSLILTKCKIDELLHDEDGEVNIIAIIIILAIAIALAIIFRKQIKELFDRIWGSINSNVDQSTGQY